MRIRGLVLFLGGFALLYAGLDARIGSVLDEGALAFGALQVSQGLQPYRDFWTAYPPGQFWVVGGLFTLFEPSLLVVRVYDSWIRSGIAALVFLLLARDGNRGLAAIAWFLSISWLWAGGYYGYPVMPAFALVLFAFYLFLQDEWRGATRTFLGIGLLLGIAAVFRYDVAAVAWASMTTVLLLRGASGERRRLLSALASMTLPVVAILGACIGYLLAVIPTEDLYAQLIFFPTKVYQQMRAMPLPSLSAGVTLERLAHYIPIGGIAIAAAGVIRWPMRSAPLRRAADVLVILMGVFLALSLLMIARKDLPHLLHLIVGSVVCVFALIAREPPSSSRRLVVVLACLVLGAFPATRALGRIAPTVHPGAAIGPRSSGYLSSLDQSAAAKFIESNVPPGEPIFVASGRHDRLIGSDVLFYFLSGRRSATKYYELGPGTTTTAPVQRQIIADIQAKNVNWILVFHGFDYFFEPNESAKSSGVRLLDEYIGAHFETVATGGNYVALRKTSNK